MLQPYLGHSGLKSDFSDSQILRDHLQAVAQLTKHHAERMNLDWPGLVESAEAAGWLHDLGKYREEFQRHIRNLPPCGCAYHKQAGAAWVMDTNNPIMAAIMGHHSRMPDLSECFNEAGLENGIDVLDRIRDIAIEENPELETLSIPDLLDESTELDLMARLLLSCLVDADWADTRQYKRGLVAKSIDSPAPLLEPQPHFDILMNTIRAKTDKTSTLGRIRNEILDAAISSADQPPGFFSMTVPTGGGKTLSAMAFALKHALNHTDDNGVSLFQRVIYVAPYMTILKQNADAYRKALGIEAGDPRLFEHYSLAEFVTRGIAEGNETSELEKLAENWDAPFIVTTNVQFFESLFTNRPGRCRKLHNIARSVIILDECQSIPSDLLAPTCEMLKQLVGKLGCTIVFCTATQPALGHEKLGQHRLDITEMMPEKLNLFNRLERVSLQWPQSRDEKLDWSEVAQRMLAQPSALCIVNTTGAAAALFQELRNGVQDDTVVIHLSTRMCPKHRIAQLEVAMKRLTENEPIYLVSTQLIEAGVDIDFPFVIRELAPLEGIIQAAGRCNRENKLGKLGVVEVFRSIEGKMPTDRWYKAGRNTVETAFLANGHIPSIDKAEDIAKYYQHLYWSGNLDEWNVVGLRNGMQFNEVAEHYRLIDDDTVPVIVTTWEGHQAEVERLIAAVCERPNRANFRALLPYQVTVYRSMLKSLMPLYIHQVNERLNLWGWGGLYSPDVGIVAELPQDFCV